MISPVFSFKLYTNSENTGNSYNLRSMTENIDWRFKTDAIWYSDYTKAYNTATASGAILSDAHRLARNAADEGRFQPGTPSFNEVLAHLQQINNWDVGALKSKISSSAHRITMECESDVAIFSSKTSSRCISWYGSKNLYHWL